MDRFLSALSSGWGAELLHGLLITLEISVGGYATGLLIGGGVAWVKLRGPKWAILMANGYTTVSRAVPEILLILILFYAGQSGLNSLLESLGIASIDISGFVVAIVVLGVVQGAYSSEILRAAILAIPKGQVESAQAYGMHGFVLFKRTILPLMLPYAFAGLTNLWMLIIKDSVLVSVVGYNELTFTASQAAGVTKLYFQFYILLGLLYYIVTQLSSVGIDLIEKRIRRWMPRHC